MRKYILSSEPSTKTSHENQTPSRGDLELAFDVGHSSLGWSALSRVEKNGIAILGCGVVTFPANDCLASQRRAFRRQRRHIRATRLRISRIERLLAHLGVLSKQEIEQKHAPGGGHSAPWLLAARVIRGGSLLTWIELWDVLRWYAHNRGYDGNRAWSSHEVEAQKEDSEKEENARSLYAKHGTRTMSETFCAVSGLDPLGAKISCNLSGEKRPKALNAAFPREDVESEVRTVLEKHIGKLARIDEALLGALLTDWTAIPCDSIRLPRRFGQILRDGRRTPGGLLFGQLIPRFDNRIIARCPMTFERVYQSALKESDDTTGAIHEAEKLSKVPAKSCPEFLRFRWAMQVANIQVATGGKSTRSLSRDERAALDAKMQPVGFLTPDKFKKAVREITGSPLDNLEQMLAHPESGEALVLDPARKALSRAPWNSIFPALPESAQRHLLTNLHRGKTVTLGAFVEKHPDLSRTLDAVLAAENTKGARGKKSVSREDLSKTTISSELLSGRAPFSREIMRATAEFVFTTDRHPTEEGGPLYRSEAIRTAQLQRAIDEQTNNRLVRHRLLILERLHRDILKEFAGNDPSRIARVTIEVNRELREMSGKTAKQVAQEMGQRLANFSSVTKRLEKAFAGQNIRITPGLIRKARIAEDLDWKCPYTGKDYDEFDLLHRKVDKDHIIPRSDRASDSLDSLVITFAEVNKMKGKRTAARFVEDCQAQTVEGLPSVQIKTLSNFLKDVDSLEAFKGHGDDKRRKKRRKEMLALRDYVEKEFTPRDLTQTSQLVRLGAQMLEKAYLSEATKPVITSLPGSVTGAVRKSWKLLGCLATANPAILEPDGEVRTKTEIRGITHLHHALDACVLGLAGIFLPRDGGAWELLVKRRLNPAEQKRARELFGNWIEISAEGQLQLADLPKSLKEQIRLRLAEKRVVQHIPSEQTGLRVEQNAWRVVSVKGGEALLRQRIRQPDGSRPLKETREKVGKLLGLQSGGGIGKLQRNKSALVIPDNFGLALDPVPQIIPFHKVHVRLRDLKIQNGGKWPRVLRNGMIIQVSAGRYSGIWRVFSVKASLTIDIGSADKVALASSGLGQKREVLVKTLLRDGLAVVDAGYTGVPVAVVSD